MVLPVVFFLGVTVWIVLMASVTADLWRRRRLTAGRVEAEFFTDKRQRPVLFQAPSAAPLPDVLDPGDTTLPQPVRLDPVQQLRRKLTQSRLPLTFEQVLGLALAGALVAGVSLTLSLGWTAGLAGAAAGGVLPFLYVHWRWKARRDKLMDQLPDAFDLMARVIRAGHSVPQAVQSIVEEFEPPVAEEFRYCQEQQNLGLLPEVTFRELAQRADVLEVKIFVMALLVQRQTGGNLTELLERLASVVRDRMRIRGQVKALSAEGRMQAVVLMVLPPLMFAVMMVVSPEYAQLLLEHVHLLIGMAVLMAIGAAWIHRIVNFEV
jgi:tight adherence protein B